MFLISWTARRSPVGFHSRPTGGSRLVPQGQKPSLPVASIHRQDTRTNIPTEELRDFVADPSPASGKIAVKVINHYGDEVLKVFLV